MRRKHNKNLLCFARELRNNPTKEEKKLWYDFLSSYQIRFTRQRCSDNILPISIALGQNSSSNSTDRNTLPTRGYVTIKRGASFWKNTDLKS